MGGKSTFLRQTALIVLMAQCGLFVPADGAKIGVVDAIFTRIGSSDSLTTNESTFMLEMKETAAILKNATRRSLVIVDEIGRGTSPFEGKVIAKAVAQYLLETNRSRVLFATHFYAELMNGANEHPLHCPNDIYDERKDDPADNHMDKINTEMKNKCVDMGSSQERPSNLPIAFWKTNAITDEATKGIIFLHKIIPGIASTSNSIQVARLAGIPEAILKAIEMEKPERSRSADLVEMTILNEIQQCDLKEINARLALRLLCGWRKRLDKQHRSHA